MNHGMVGPKGHGVLNDSSQRLVLAWQDGRGQVVIVPPHSTIPVPYGPDTAGLFEGTVAGVAGPENPGPFTLLVTPSFADVMPTTQVGSHEAKGASAADGAAAPKMFRGHVPVHIALGATTQVDTPHGLRMRRGKSYLHIADTDDTAAGSAAPPVATAMATSGCTPVPPVIVSTSTAWTVGAIVTCVIFGVLAIVAVAMWSVTTRRCRAGTGKKHTVHSFHSVP